MHPFLTDPLRPVPHMYNYIKLLENNFLKHHRLSIVLASPTKNKWIVCEGPWIFISLKGLCKDIRVTISHRVATMYTKSSSARGAFHQAFCQCFSLTTVISYWNPCIWLAESKFVSEKHWQNAWWNAPQICCKTLFCFVHPLWTWIISCLLVQNNQVAHMSLKFRAY